MLYISVDNLLNEEPIDASPKKNTKKNFSKKNGLQNSCEGNELICKKKKKKQKQLIERTKKTENDNDPNPKEMDSQNIKRNKKDANNTGKATLKSVKLSEGNFSLTENTGYTDDGFKIVSSIPEDDSDISDAFESCSEGENDIDEQDISSSRRETEDGFKIMTAVPPDDSDVSDAFEDGEEDDFVDTALSSQQRGIKKPLIQIMDDFGKHLVYKLKMNR